MAHIMSLGLAGHAAISIVFFTFITAQQRAAILRWEMEFASPFPPETRRAFWRLGWSILTLYVIVLPLVYWVIL